MQRRLAALILMSFAQPRRVSPVRLSRQCSHVLQPKRHHLTPSRCARGVAQAVVVLGSVVSMPAWVHAQTSPSVVVTATRYQTRADELVSDVVVIDRNAIERAASGSIVDVLTREAGISISANGSLGKAANVNVRGTENRHVLLIIDGVRYESATLGAPVWDNIPLDLIERIEVLKGPGSALYGSSAVGGVIQIFTKRGEAGFKPYASATLGSRDFGRIGTGFSGGSNGLRYNLGVQMLRDGSLSSTNDKAPFGNHNPDRDPFRQNALSGSLSWTIVPDWQLQVGGTAAYSVNHWDDGPGMDTRSRQISRTLRAELSGKVTPIWKTSLRVSESVDDAKAIEASWLPSKYVTKNQQLAWQNEIRTGLGTALLGLEQLRQDVDSSTTYNVTSRTIDSVFAGLHGQKDAHTWQANLRHDSNSQFGDHTTGFVGYGYALTSALRLRGSYGTSFVAPSFNQLYYPGFSNPLLQPEKGRNAELGLVWTQGAHQLAVTRFDNRVRGYITNTTIPDNVPKARMEGWTLAYTGQIGATGLRATLDLVDPRNVRTGEVLPRRAREQLSVQADYTIGKLKLGGSVLAMGKRSDVTYDASFNQVAAKLGGFATADLFASYPLSRDWQLQARLANLADKRYETAYGYNQPGRTAFVTLRWQGQ